MKVFNLTNHPLDFHGRVIAPNGGSLDYPELDAFLPSRDKKLEELRYIAFGFLPTWWKKQQEKKPQVPHKRVTLKLSDDVKVFDSVSTRTSRHGKKYQG